jgi:hypothetical protein
LPISIRLQAWEDRYTRLRFGRKDTAGQADVKPKYQRQPVER